MYTLAHNPVAHKFFLYFYGIVGRIWIWMLACVLYLHYIGHLLCISLYAMDILGLSFLICGRTRVV